MYSMLLQVVGSFRIEASLVSCAFVDGEVPC